MAKKKKQETDEELSLEQAQNVIRRLGDPDRKNKELELLKQASVVIAKELQPEFEFEDEEGGDVDIGLASDAQTTSELTKAPGFLEHASSQLASLGTAGVMAIASATYFQVDTVVEQTREVAAKAEEKWEEFEEEHPGFNWDDPLEAFTTVVGIGELDIDIDPTTGAAIEPENKEANESTGVSETTEQDGQEEPSEENTEGDDGSASEEPTEDTEESEVEEEQEEEAKEETEEEEPKKKKKKGFLGLFGGDDDDEEEAEEEESEDDNTEETNEGEEDSSENEESEETETEESKEESEEPVAEEESSEPEPEAEEEPAQEEKPKKKSGGLFSALFGGGDDEESEEPEDEPREEPQQDDTIPDEQATEETDTEPEAEATDGEVADGEPTAEPAEGTNVAESNGVEKKSSGGGLLSIFGFGNSEEEVVEDSEVSTDEEPEILVADSDMEATDPPSEEPEVEVEPIDAMDDIKPHSMVGDEAFVETDIEVKEPEVEVAEIEMDVDVNIEDILEMSEVAIEDVAVVDVGGDDIINDIDKVLTPINGGREVSPVGGNINWADIFDPHNPSNSESDATPI